MRLLPLFLLPAALFAAQTRYARLGEFEGTVEVQLHAADPWIPAERNLPLPELAWLRTGPASRLEIELDEGSVWRLGPNSQAEISDYSRLSTGQRVTLLSLDHGLAYFTGQPEGKDALILAVPGAQVTLIRGARLRFEAQESWSQIAVIEGMVRFSSPAAEIDIREGQSTRVEPANPARFFLNKEVPSLELDRWNEQRDQALESSTSAAHVIQRYGLVDLDTAGEWTQTEDLGPVWKPKASQGWVPFQNGRWRWYDTLGYTWVSDEPWGWLPYHYGRWLRKENLGWVWVPAQNPVFKPGEVYWLRGAKLAGWGPLAPGEDWRPAPDRSTPQQFLNAHTTFAQFQADAATIDPAGFTGRPKEPLQVAAFTSALPSPALPASRLDAVRPELRAGSTRVTPVLPGVTFQNSPSPAIVVNPPAPPTVIVTPPPDPPQTGPQTGPPPPDPNAIAAITDIILTNPPEHPVYSRRPPVPTAAPPRSAPPAPAPAPAPTATASNGGTPPPLSTGPRHDTPAPARPKPEPPLPPIHDKRFRSSAESEIAGEVVKDVNARNFPKALVDLDAWSQRFHDSDYGDDRLYYYVLAHNGIEQPAKVLDTAAPLVARASSTTLDDPRQMILVLYLTSLNAQKLPNATRDQVVTGRTAARALLESVNSYFTPENRPAATSSSDWAKARTDLEATAQTTLKTLSARH